MMKEMEDEGGYGELIYPCKIIAWQDVYENMNDLNSKFDQAELYS